MSTFTRAASIVAAAAMLVTGLAACSSGGSAKADGTSSAAACTSMENVNFGYIGDFNGTSLLAIAKDQDLWKKQCLNVTPKVFTNGPLQITALGSGSLDFGYIGPGALWLPAEGKAKIVAIDTFGNADRIVALPGKGIKNVADLKGKKVGFPQGTSGEMILRLGLQKAGMTMSDVDAVPIDPSTMVAALSSGQVDAAGFWYPALSTVKQKVPDLVELAKDSDFKKEMTFPTAFVTQQDLPTRNPKMVSRVLTVLKQANTYRFKHEDEAIKLTAAMNNLDVAAVKSDASFDQMISTEDLVKYSKDGTVEKWLDTFGDYFVKTGTLKDPGKASNYYTADLYAKAGN
jgi:NitT/TauT family transport system substrate-binding protein